MKPRVIAAGIVTFLFCFWFPIARALYRYLQTP